MMLLYIFKQKIMYVIIMIMKNTFGNTIAISTVFCLAVFLLSLFSNSILKLASDQVAFVSEVGANVVETPTNKLAAQLRDKTIELDLREKALNEKELLLQKEREAVAARTRNILLSTISLSFISLLIINLYIYRRDKKAVNIGKNFGYSLLHTGNRNYRVDLHKN